MGFLLPSTPTFVLKPKARKTEDRVRLRYLKDTP